MAGTAKISTIQHDVSGVATLFKDGAGTEIGQLCKSWANFNGVSGSVAVRASFNVSSVVRGATAGWYTITFTTSMVDANHAPTGNANPNNYGGAYPGFGTTAAGTQTATTAQAETRDANNAATDSNFILMNVHR
jgi:hypothetical protein